MNPARKTIHATIAANREYVNGHLTDLFQRTAEDLIAGGIELPDVARAAMAVACHLNCRLFGKAGVPDALRDAADAIERDLMGETAGHA